MRLGRSSRLRSVTATRQRSSPQLFVVAEGSKNQTIRKVFSMTILAEFTRAPHDPALKLAPVRRRRVAAPQPGSGERLAYTIYEAAESLGETSDMIARFCRTKVFPNAYKGGLGGRTSPWRIPAKDLTDFMAKRGGAK